MITRNVVCMKWGNKYSPEYVNILARMVRRNITPPYRFICLTDDPAGIEEEVEIRPIPSFTEPAPEYYRQCQAWRKLLLFEDPLYDLTGKILFFDLDVVIVGNIDCFFAYADKLAIVENWSQPNRLIGQASAFCFEVGRYRELLSEYLIHPDETARQYRTEQVYITRRLGRGNFEFFPAEWCRSFKFHCMPGGVLNSFFTPRQVGKEARVIVFHGNPNPPEAIAGAWGAPVPWYKKFYKTVRPTPWLAEYWR
ncbi:MAG TPA: hypothetical protein ENN98_04625 [Desulfurivibrio alkaliphilus]|uniref:Glycosyltransferase n=1 Tax=Desulfurivibrio alkaliphilus TaxID=427923 RepID=A0A7C2TGD3_9BACT|nr:hypothetical protein [Desulfurivibrio alkaliphilus]